MVTYQLIFVGFIAVIVGTDATAPLVNLQNCDGGCKTAADCATNAACIPVLAPNCGLCVCTVGYVMERTECVASSSSSGSTGGSSSSSSSSNSSSVSQASEIEQKPSAAQVVHPVEQDSKKDNDASTNTIESSINSNTSTNNGEQSVSGEQTSQSPLSSSSSLSTDSTSGTTESQPAPPPEKLFDCEKYNCDGANSKNCAAESTKPKACPNLAGGGQCMLGDCFKVNATVSYCLCPFGRQSRTCHVTKTGHCENTDGQLPSGATETKNKRFRHIRDPESGAVLARHSVQNFGECIRLCQWASFQQCRSLNYGTINGKQICELLTVWATPDSILSQWLVDDKDWTYACCFK